MGRPRARSTPFKEMFWKDHVGPLLRSKPSPKARAATGEAGRGSPLAECAAASNNLMTMQPSASLHHTPKAQKFQVILIVYFIKKFLKLFFILKRQHLFIKNKKQKGNCKVFPYKSTYQKQSPKHTTFRFFPVCVHMSFL